MDTLLYIIENISSLWLSMSVGILVGIILTIVYFQLKKHCNLDDSGEVEHTLNVRINYKR